MNTTQRDFAIVKYTDRYREQLLDVWERSVVATHDFLCATDFQEIKELVADINFNEFDVYCALHDNRVAGFIGTLNDKVEMLFLAPEYIGKGLGKKLLHFAIHDLKANKVDVNEQNTKAVAFYSGFGFKIYARTDKDDQGKNYPLLRMALE